MKKFLAFAVACVALAACTRSEAPVAFRAGQKVTISVNAASGTKVASTLKNGSLNFTWEEGDQILVIVGEETAVFTIKDGFAGQARAEFEGEMPADGSTFDAQFPVDLAGLVAGLGNQTYVANALPHNVFYATASDCTLEGFDFNVKSSALQLNLYGEEVIGKIELALTNNDTTIELNCGDGVTTGTTSATATPFLIALPAGEYSFKVSIYNNADSTITQFVKKDALSFPEGVIVSMPAKEVKKASNEYPGAPGIDPIIIGESIWAPVNCGYDAEHPLGLLYQWGRKYGMEPEAHTSVEMTKEQGQLEANKDVFGKATANSNWWWYAGDADYTLWKEGDKGQYDPCPEGWRVPTMDEFGHLAFTDWDYTTHSGTQYRFTWDEDKQLADFGQAKIPAVSVLIYSGQPGPIMFINYWTTTINSYDGFPYVFVGGGMSGEQYAGFITRDGYVPACGIAVRCIKERY